VRARPQLGTRQLIRRRRCAVDDVGDADPEFQQIALVERREDAIREPARV
jgi:hypothetical protein